MNESEYYTGEFTDADLNALADAGEFYLDESGFFLMPTQKEMQELAAVLECTQLNFLPADWRARVLESGGRARLQERFMEVRQLLEA